MKTILNRRVLLSLATVAAAILFHALMNMADGVRHATEARLEHAGIVSGR